MIAPIKLMMAELAGSRPAFLPSPVTPLSQRRWMIEREGGPIVQFEPFDDGKRGLVYSSTARDGSGPLRTSFLTMLMLEDSFAMLDGRKGVCSGVASVTIYQIVDLTSVSANDIATIMGHFMTEAERALCGYFNLPPSVEADESHAIMCE